MQRASYPPWLPVPCSSVLVNSDGSPVRTCGVNKNGNGTHPSAKGKGLDKDAPSGTPGGLYWEVKSGRREERRTVGGKNWKRK